jgi:hypothetical protein
VLQAGQHRVDQPRLRHESGGFCGGGDQALLGGEDPLGGEPLRGVLVEDTLAVQAAQLRRLGDQARRGDADGESWVFPGGDRVGPGGWPSGAPTPSVSPDPASPSGS